MNLHHLELFYYVARHGGISRAVRAMPYGIQQPAVSGQILLLEADLGVRLFDRSPFRLTPEGAELYGFVRPFFEGLPAAGARLRGRAAPRLRVAGSELVLRDYLPAVMGSIRRREPRLQLALRSGLQKEMETWLLEGDVDVAFTPLESRPPPRIRCRRLVRMPLVLVVPARSRLTSAGGLWGRQELREPLITLPATEVVSRNFQKGLHRRGVDWPRRIEASSMDLVNRYVANGYGIGVSVDAGQASRTPGVRMIPLPDFDPVVVAALWTAAPHPLVQELIGEAARYVADRWPERALGSGSA